MQKTRWDPLLGRALSVVEGGHGLDCCTDLVGIRNQYKTKFSRVIALVNYIAESFT